MGCEYAENRLVKFFRDVKDVRDIVQSIKRWELETKLILREEHNKEKY